MKKNSNRTMLVKCPSCGEVVYYTPIDMRYYIDSKNGKNCYLTCKGGKKCGGSIKVSNLTIDQKAFIVQSIAQDNYRSLRSRKNLTVLLKELEDAEIASIIKKEDQLVLDIVIDCFPKEKFKSILNQIPKEMIDEIEKEYPQISIK